MYIYTLNTYKHCILDGNKEIGVEQLLLCVCVFVLEHIFVKFHMQKYVWS
jgi:hypothetical protein